MTTGWQSKLWLLLLLLNSSYLTHVTVLILLRWGWTCFQFEGTWIRINFSSLLLTIQNYQSESQILIAIQSYFRGSQKPELAFVKIPSLFVNLEQLRSGSKVSFIITVFQSNLLLAILYHILQTKTAFDFQLVLPLTGFRVKLALL